MAAPQHARQAAPPPQSATEESTVSASTNSASGNWRVVRKKTAKAQKRAMKRPPRRSKKGYTAAKGNGYVFTGKELQAVARRRSEAFGDLDRAVRED